MKFADVVASYQIEAWSRHYISYKCLRALAYSYIESVQCERSDGMMTSHCFHYLPNVVSSLMNGIENEKHKVTSFLNFKIKYYQEKLERLSTFNFDLEKKFNYYNSISPSFYRREDEFKDIVDNIIQAKTQIVNLLELKKINLRGLDKVFKKIQKHLNPTIIDDTLISKEVCIHEEFNVIEESFVRLSTLLNNLSNKIIDRSVFNTADDSVNAEDKNLITMMDEFKKLISVDYERDISISIKHNENETLRLKLEEIKSYLASFSPDNPSVIKKEILDLLNLWLKEASFSGNIESIKYIIEAGANVNNKYSCSEKTIIHDLIESSNKKTTSVLRTFLDYGFDILCKDSLGRLPIHLTAIYEDACTFKLLYLLCPSSINISDLDHLNFLDHVIDCGNLEILNAMKEIKADTAIHLEHVHDYIFKVCRTGNKEMLSFLLDFTDNIDFLSPEGESALHVAAAHNNADCVQLLLRKGAATNITEKYKKWTPIFYSVTIGSEAIVKLLIDAKADLFLKDYNGWNVYQYALYKGYIKVYELLKSHRNTSQLPPPFMSMSSPVTSKVARKEYGHTFLQSKGVLQIYPGLSLDGSSIPMVHFKDETLTGPLVSLSLKFSIGDPFIGGPFLFDNLGTTTHHTSNATSCLQWHFPCDHPKNHPVFKDEVLWLQMYSNFFGSVQLVAIGSLLLSNFNKIGANTCEKNHIISSTSFVTVPLLSVKNQQLVATVNLSYLVVLPYFYEDIKPEDPTSFWKALTSKVIGHRGFGANENVFRPQLGENTILSFVTAASLGAEYVEFDVQVTKDLVPVIYHDFLLNEENNRVPVTSLYLKNFLNLRSNNLPKKSITKMRNSSTHNFLCETSLFSKDDGYTYTKRPSETLNIIQGELPSLEQVFNRVPKDLGFNIEIKYPSMEERRVYQIDFAHDINTYCDAILECVFKSAKKRSIIFSSFSPHVCILLSMKQANFPVLFLSRSGKVQTIDPLCASIEGAIQFANCYNLFGVVLESTPLVEEPSLIQVVKSYGLLLFTYGSKNNIIEHAKMQKENGVDAIIIDNIAYIKRNLSMMGDE